jgi:hypothetical protein
MYEKQNPIPDPADAPAVHAIYGRFCEDSYAGITLSDPASVRLHQRIGFQLVGVFRQVGYKPGAWHDVSWRAMILQPTERPPQETLSIEEVIQRPNFLAAIKWGES